MDLPRGMMCVGMSSNVIRKHGSSYRFPCTHSIVCSVGNQYGTQFKNIGNVFQNAEGKPSMMVCLAPIGIPMLRVYADGCRPSMSHVHVCE